MPEPTVTVIIPCHNQGRYLQESAGSALGQTHPEMEVIIIDDGSTDETREVAERLVRLHPGRVQSISQVRQGQNEARQRGLETATGTYCITLDADDLLEPRAAELCLKVFAAQPSADAVVGNAFIVNADGRQVLRTHTQNRIVPWPEILKRNPYGVNLGVMSRVSSLCAVGGLAFRHAGCEDWDVWCRMARCGMKFIALDAVLGRYRQTGQNHTRNVLSNLQATIAMLDLAASEDLRLFCSGRRVSAPIPPERYQLYRNGRVFHALGLGVGFGLEQDQIDAIAEQLVPSRLHAAWYAEQFSEGLHFALTPLTGGSGKTAGPTLSIRDLLKNLPTRLKETSDPTRFPELRAALIHAVRQATGRRSLLYLAQRLREKLFH